MDATSNIDTTKAYGQTGTPRSLSNDVQPFMIKRETIASPPSKPSGTNSMSNMVQGFPGETNNNTLQTLSNSSIQSENPPVSTPSNTLS
jgi:hypothetical protein